MLYIMLILAIVAEVIATTALRLTDGMTRPVPIAVMTVCYIVSFCLLSQVVRHFSLGITYAVWSGVGLIFICLIGIFKFGQRLDLPAITGMCLIISGVAVIQLFSKSVHQ